MGTKKPRRKSLPTLGLGDPGRDYSHGYGAPFTELAAPSVPPHTPGAEIAMGMEVALAVEEDLGPEVAQGLSTAELADYLDGRGLRYRWTMPRH